MRGEFEVYAIDKKGRKRLVRFDRAKSVYCAAYIEIQRNENYTAIDIEAIKKAIANTDFNTGDDVKLSRLYSPINTVEGFSVNELKIGRVDETLASTNIHIDIRERARFRVEDIEVVSP